MQAEWEGKLLGIENENVRLVRHVRGVSRR